MKQYFALETANKTDVSSYFAPEAGHLRSLGPTYHTLGKRFNPRFHYKEFIHAPELRPQRLQREK
jgi:hypothetical protein